MSTKLPTMAEEAERISKERGYYISPWQLNEMMKLANKLVNTIVPSKSGMTYAEAQLVLELAKSNLDFPQRKE